MRGEDMKECDHIIGVYHIECEAFDFWVVSGVSMREAKNRNNFTPFKYCPLCGEKNDET